MEPFVRVFRVNAVGKEGRPIVLGSADTASQALAHFRDAMGDYPRAWVTDEDNLDVSVTELMRLADEESSSG